MPGRLFNRPYLFKGTNSRNSGGHPVPSSNSSAAPPSACPRRWSTLELSAGTIVFCTLGTAEKLALFATTSSFTALHLIGWNFTFPSRTKRLLWRLSSGIVTFATVFFWVFETVAARHRFGRWDKYLIWLQLKKPAPQPELPEQADQTATESKSDSTAPIETTVFETGPVRQNTLYQLNAFEKEQQQAKPILMWEVALIFPMVLLYAASRAYLLAEVFVSMRSIPSGVYETFDFANVLPHW